MAVYQEETGDRTPAMSSGGATFARTMENCVAFGALFPGAEQTEHQANERAKINDLYAAMEIYREAIQRLATIYKKVWKLGFQTFITKTKLY